MSLALELSQVLNNAMHRFEQVPGSSDSADMSGLGLAGKSAQRILVRLAAIAVIAALLFGLPRAFNVLGTALAALGAPPFVQTAALTVIAIGTLLAAVTALRAVNRRRRAVAKRRIDAASPVLGAVIDRMTRLVDALPPSMAPLAENVARAERRMRRTFSGHRPAFSLALVKLGAKAFGYEGFDRLAADVPAAAQPLHDLRGALETARTSLAPSPSAR